MKRVAINGVRYRLGVRRDGRVEILGPYVRGGWVLPEGVTLDSPDLRDQVAAAMDRYRQHRADVSAFVRDQVRSGAAGLRGYPPVVPEEPSASARTRPAFHPADVFGLD